MVLETISWLDVNGIGASNKFWVTDDAAAQTVLADLKKLSNAKVTNAQYGTPLDLTAIGANTAVTANVETARAKMAITLGAPPATAGGPRQTVTIQIPAPVGTYINGLSGDVNNPDIQALVGLVVTQAGTATDSIEKVVYVK